ncbi:hypothetical protein HS048_31480 [Planomonospora sp. ID91781]|jgi:hypothetical protein|uniref:Membrane protein n=3 Tax=Planomonospora TaxID=1998 RepID=A0A171CYB9_9ACTN|nr:MULTISPECIES: DUF6458 family protein [Planomonospora]MBG0825215.1 hypothetical protein [Planomonospora sp. ID91781]GAT67416.1 membrane protein [Planomonospora sphaerica]GGK52000.1 hypothetical protein GCM10010126_09350 [Planomonospora parontospora]GGL41967.1 hypothetical protein GCM10014719_49020 [Planomonospora parontospora subsp. antibiotica]GII06928.1 hypothetical protein Ppa06_07260 [Planomonospora parontospora subsp. parontospora]
MTIAGGIILIMLGAIFTWAVEFDLAGFDINILGVILMLGGLVWLLIAIYRMNVARRAIAPTTVVVEEDPVTHRRVYEERHYDDPPVV